MKHYLHFCQFVPNTPNNGDSTDSRMNPLKSNSNTIFKYKEGKDKSGK